VDEISESISKWIKEQRLGKNLTLTELGQLTGLTHSQLSHVETGASSVTLFTLMRVFFALDRSFINLTSENIIPNDYPLPKIYYHNEPSSFEFPTFRIADCDDIILYFIGKGRHKKTLIKWLSNYLEIKKGFNPEQAQIEAETLLYEITLPPTIRENDLSSITYPANIDAEVFTKIFLSGGAFIFHDAGAYLRSIRLNKGLSLRQLGAKVGISQPWLAKLENQFNARVKFYDILNLDRTLELGGNLIQIAWRVGELYLGTIRSSSIFTKRPQPYTQAEIEWIETLIFMQRIFENDGMDVAQFIQEIRALSVPTLTTIGR
jgi:transcriptional regulator with XRE-family HTH domain